MTIMKNGFFLCLAVLFTALNLEAMPHKNVATAISPQSLHQQRSSSKQIGHMFYITVVGDNDYPLNSADVQIKRNNKVVSVGSTNWYGNFVFKDVRANDILYVSYPDYEPYSQILSDTDAAQIIRLYRKGHKSRPLTGIVVNEKGEPVANASVKSDDGRQRTVTANDGTFKLTDVSKASAITVFHYKYEKKSEQINGRNHIKVVLSTKEETDKQKTNGHRSESTSQNSSQGYGSRPNSAPRKKPSSISGQQSCIGDHLAFMGISMGINMKAMMSKLRDKGFYDTDHLYDEATMRGIFYKVQVHVGFMSENGHLKTIRVVDADTEYQKRVAQKRFEDLLNKLKAVYGEGKYVSRESWESRYEITLDCGTIIIQMIDSDEMDASSGVYTVSVVFNNNKE